MSSSPISRPVPARAFVVLSVLSGLLPACFDESAGLSIVGAETSGGGGTDTIGLDDTTRVGETLQDAAAATEVAPLCPGGAGCTCQEHKNCDTGLCIDTVEGGLRCAQKCSETCPNGFKCASVPAGSDIVNICVPKWGRLCSPCKASVDCAGLGLAEKATACVSFGAGGAYCSVACSGSGDCKEGYLCAPLQTLEGMDGNWCVPVPAAATATVGECACSPVAVQKGLSTACFVQASPTSKCVGERTCTAAGLSACSVAGAQPEVCNGKDDDCDGQTDEAACDDAKPCTTDACDPKVPGPDGSGCTHKNVSGASCNADDNACTDDDHCEDGVCQPGKTKNCDDGNPCTKDACDAAQGCTQTADDGKPCDDANACTQSDVCKASACAGKAKPDSCDDGDPCTKDTCDKKKGCTNVIDETKCAVCETNADCAALDDGNPCNGAVKCLSSGGAVKTCAVDPKTVVKCDAGADSACEKQQCDPKTGGCKFKAVVDGAPCEADGTVCTVDDACKAGTCQPGAKKDCDDGEPCTTDACDAKTGCTHADNALPCDDGQACTIGDKCKGGKCTGGSAKSCDDGNACTADTCAAATGACASQPVANGSPCGANGEQCNAGKCGAGATCGNGKVETGETCSTCPADAKCDDANPCTDDVCDAATAKCTNKVNTASCSDGNACTTGDVCAGGKCAGGSAKSCNDGNTCTTDTCAAATGACTWQPVVDGSPCGANGEKCTAGKCGTGAACGNGKVESGETCSNCPSDVKCDDFNPCTADQCTSGTCSYTLSGPSGCCNPNLLFKNFDDSKLDPLTVQGTNALAKWQVTTGKQAKSGAGALYYGDVAKLNFAGGGKNSGSVTLPVVSVPALGTTTLQFAAWLDVETDQSYDKLELVAVGPGTVLWSKAKAMGLTMKAWQTWTVDVSAFAGKDLQLAFKFDTVDDINNNGQGVYLDDIALTKQCSGLGGCKSSADCNDANPCTDDACDTLTAKCTSKANSASCSDGNACTTGDTCTGGKCAPSGTKSCDDGNSCTNDTCSPSQGCAQSPVANGTSCNGGAGTCDAGACKVTGCKNNSECADGLPCTADLCNASTGKCSNPPSDGASCNDGNSCTLNDTCQGGSCQGGSQKSCSDGNPCTNDSCSPSSGCQYTNNGNSCSDGNSCTVNDSCQGGSCQGGPQKSCDDANPCTNDSCSGGSCTSSNKANGTACNATGTCQNGSCVVCNATNWWSPASAKQWMSGKSSDPKVTSVPSLSSELGLSGKNVQFRTCKSSGTFTGPLWIDVGDWITGYYLSAKADPAGSTCSSWKTLNIDYGKVKAGMKFQAQAVRIVSPDTCESKWDTGCNFKGGTACGFCWIGSTDSMTATCLWP